MVIGYEVMVSFWISVMYWLTPVESDNINAIPIIPIEPANAVKNVLPFLVFKLLKLRARAVSYTHLDVYKRQDF